MAVFVADGVDSTDDLGVFMDGVLVLHDCLLVGYGDIEASEA